MLYYVSYWWYFAVRGESHTLLDVSYCYVGMTGILITLVVSTLASLCTGKSSSQHT